MVQAARSNQITNMIIRNPQKAAKRNYDLIIIGGGVYGTMLSYEAAKRGLQPLLIERDDFGEHTSYNSLRIIHGGLRYLQKLDFNRFQESVQERHWFLKTFPNLVRPLPCLMPLYSKGMKRPGIFRIALILNHFLSRKRNENIPPKQHLEAGQVISPQETQKLFPAVNTHNLTGGAVWHDACMPDPQRVIMQALLWACEFGATQLNYVEAVQLNVEKKQVKGVSARDKTSGEKLQFNAPIVINSAGPWCREIAHNFHCESGTLPPPSLAWNVLFDRKAISTHALAVTPNKPGSRTYFVVPWKGKIMAGTGHAPLDKTTKTPHPTGKQLLSFINELNLAIPEINLTQNDVAHTYSGILPATKEGSTELSCREVIIDHSKDMGPKGFYSLSGVKFTTSRLVAEKAIKLMFPDIVHNDILKQSKLPLQTTTDYKYDWLPQEIDIKLSSELKELIKTESVCFPEDLIYRRTSLGDNPKRTDFVINKLTRQLLKINNP